MDRALATCPRRASPFSPSLSLSLAHFATQSEALTIRGREDAMTTVIEPRYQR